MNVESVISVIVPVYNASSTIGRCVDSILAQSFANIECILVDDGSSDESGRICDEYAKLDGRIRVFHKRNGGMCSARNVGLDMAASEWVFFCDADDYLPIDALEYLYENTDKSDFVIGGVSCLCTCNQYIPEKYIWPGDSGVFLESQMLRLYCITAWGKLYNRKVVGSLRFNEHFTVSEDLDFNWRYMLLVKSISFVNEVVYCYFDNSAPNKYRLDYESYQYCRDHLITTLNLYKEKFGCSFEQEERYVYVFHTARLLYHISEIKSFPVFNREIKCICRDEICFDSWKKRVFWAFCYHLPWLSYLMLRLTSVLR